MLVVLAVGAVGAVARPAGAVFSDHADDVLQPVFEVGGDSMGAGVAFVDFDVDGFEDVVVVHGTNGMRLYRNGGPDDFAFDDVTVESELPDDFPGGVAVAATDYDRDGDPDLFFAERTGLHLFRNDGTGVFEDVTEATLPVLPYYAATMSFADLDGDGWTDVYVSGYTLYLAWPFHDCSPSMILHNRRDGTFEAAHEDWGVVDTGCTLAVLASDHDRDGDVDLLAANDFGQFERANSLFRNDGLQPDGSVAFTDVSEASGFAQRIYGMGIATADVNDDGAPDYFVTSIGRDVLLLGAGDGTFADATEAWGVTAQFGSGAWRATWGTAFLDVEQDGLWDLYVASGSLPAASEIANDPIQANFLFHPLEEAERTTRARGDQHEGFGVGPVDASKGVAIGDFDADGDDDILTAALGGDVHLYRNDGDPEPVTRLTLRGSVSTPEAWGAWATLTCAGVSRAREMYSGGSYGSAHGLGLRMPLAGCEAGGEIEIAWPSGAVTRAAVDAATEALDLQEPEWVIVSPAYVAADGVSSANVVVTPRDDAGDPIGAGLSVALSATAGSVSAVSDLGDGRYEATWTSPDSPADGALTIRVDDAPMRAHPRVRFALAGTEPATIHLSPSGFVADVTDVAVTVVPRDVAGGALGAGAIVELSVASGSVTALPVDVGDGSYRATVRGDGTGPLVVSATADGVALGSRGLPEILAVDPARTRVWLEPGYVDEATLAFDQISIVVSPRTSEDAITPGFELFDYRLVTAGGEIVPDATIVRSASVTMNVPAQTLHDEGPARLEIDGVPLPKDLEVVTYADPAELAAHVDPARSRTGVFHQTAYADGDDMAWVVATLKDADDDIVPVTDVTAWECGEMELLESKITGVGRELRARFRSGLVPGRADLDVTIDGALVGVSTWIDLLGPVEHDVADVEVETCLDDVEREADGVGTVRAVVRARFGDGNLTGSNVPLTMSADGEALALDYTRPGTWYAAVPVPAAPGRTTIRVTLDGTDDEAQLWIEFFPVGDPPEDLDLPLCASTRDGVVPADAGPDTGPDAGSDVDVDTDIDTDADGDSGTDPDRDAGGDDDAGSDPDLPDAGRYRIVGARGGGCGCRFVAP